MTRQSLVMVLLCGLAAGCGDGATTGGGDGAPDMSVQALPDLATPPGPDMQAPPLDMARLAAPAIGDQIDRAGRPSVASLFIDPFDFDGKQGATLDEYNHNADPTTWVARYSPMMADAIAVWDGFDKTCGNSRFYDMTNMTYSAAGYTTLATLFADDRLFINTASGKCDGYLDVESSVLLGSPLTACGGLAPGGNSINLELGLAIGAAANVNGVARDPDNPPDGGGAFPYIGEPE